MNEKEAYRYFVMSAKDSFLGLNPELSDEEVKGYFSKATKYLNSMFKSALEEYERGNITEEVLRDGSGRSAGYCMGLCYDTPMDD